MISWIRRFKGRSFAELRFRGLQQINARLERLRLRVNLAPYSGSDPVMPFSTDTVLARLSESSQAAMKSARATALELRTDDPTLVKELRTTTAGIRHGRISLMGLGSLSLGNPPHWHREGVSGTIAPFRHWSRIDYLNPTEVGDHKILWEVNRHQYLLAPALLWNMDGQAEDFELVQRHLASWLDANPTSVGVNWCSSLEVAYRAITWCWLLALLPASLWDPLIHDRLMRSLEHHGRHIERYLSYYFSPNTHLTGEALGLVYIGHVIPESRFAQRWRNLGASILESWVDAQVYEDGVYFEQSTQYQRYTAEIFLHYLRIAETNHRQVSPALRTSLSKQFDVLKTLCHGRGTMPLIGDDDGGLLFPIDQNSPEDLRGLLLAGATTLNRPDLIPEGPLQPAMSYWLCGVEATRAVQALSHEPSCCRSRYFAAGGLAVIRDGCSIDSAVAVIDAGQHGKLNCGHAHADFLACTLSLGEQPLFIDRGTFSYTRPERNDFRSTASHNTMEFDGESAVEPLAPFQWGAQPRRPTASVRACTEMTIFRGMAWGHAHTDHPSAHVRIIAHAPAGAWLCLDQGSRSPDSRPIVRWQLAPELKINLATHSCEISTPDGARLAQIAFPLTSGVGAATRDVSVRYGRKSPAVVLQAPGDPQFRVLTLVLPAASLATALTETANIEPSAQRLLSWQDSHGRHTLVFPTFCRTRLQHGGWTADADLLWHVHRAPTLPGSDGFELIVAVGARHLSAPERLTWTAEVDGCDCVLSNASGEWRRVVLCDLQVGRELHGQ